MNHPLRFDYRTPGALKARVRVGFTRGSLWGSRVLAVLRQSPVFLRAVVLLTLLVFLGSDPKVLAASLYWDTNGSAAGSSDSTSGVWGTSNFWNSDATGLDGGTFGISTALVDDLFISAANNATGANTMTLSGAQSANSLTFRNGTVTLAGTATPSLTLGNGGLTMDSTLDGTLTLNSTLTSVRLSGSQTWANNSGQAFSSSSATVIAGTAAAGGTHTLTIGGSGSGAWTVDGVISNGTGGGTLALTKTGTSTLTLRGANTYTGATTVSAGTLSLNTGLTTSAVSSFRSNVAVASGATFDVNTTSNVTVGNSFDITGTGTVVKRGTGTWIVGASGIQTAFKLGVGGLIDIQEGRIQNNNTRNSFASNLARINVAAGAVMDFYAENAQMDALTGAGIVQNAWTTGGHDVTIGVAGGSGEFSGVLQNGGATGLNVIKTGAGTQVFSGNNSFTGTLAVQAGTLSIGSINDAGVSGVLGRATSAGTLGAAGAEGTLLYTGAAGAASNRRFMLATSGTGTFNVQNATSDLVLSGSISGSGRLVKEGAGLLTLSGSNSYTGATQVNRGMLVAGSANALGAGSGASVTVASGAGLNYRAVANGTLNIGGSLTLQGGAGSFLGTSLGSTLSGAQINVAGIASVSGAYTLGVSSVPGFSVASGTHTLIRGVSASSTLAAGTATLVLYNASNYTVVGSPMFSNQDIKLQVASAAELSDAYWKAGGYAAAPNVWAISDGTSASNWSSTDGGVAQMLVPGTSTLVTIGAGGSAASTVLGADMSIRGLVIADGSSGLGLNADGNALTLGSAGIQVGASAPASTIGADVVLGAAQTWTNASANRLSVSGGIRNGGNLLTLGGAGDVALSGGMSGAGGLTKTGSGTAILAGVNLYAGTTLISSGTLQVGDGVLDGVISNSAITNNAALRFQTLGTQVHSGVISGSGRVEKAGGGMLTLSGSNTYTGATTVSGGTLKAGVGVQAFGVNSAVTLANASGGVLDITGFNQTVGSLAGGGASGGNVTLGSAVLTVGANNTSTSY
ncbi:MAG: hypothetical protein RLZZ399_2287, partial [Verrucomicrobiota bacterium]